VAALQVASKHGERVLDTPGNPISVGFTLATLQPPLPAEQPAPATVVGGGDGSRNRATSPANSEDDADADADDDDDHAERLATGLDGLAVHAEPAPPLGASQQRRRGLDVTFLGSMLFSRCISGTRVVPRHASKSVAGTVFQGFGAHCDDYPVPYLTAAAALGTTELDVQAFAARLDKCLTEFKKKQAKLLRPPPPP